MEAYNLPKKNILGIHARMEGLRHLERQILKLSPEARFDKASSSEEGRRLILRNNYDMIVSDILRSPGLNLVDLIASLKVPVLIVSDGGSRGRLPRFDGLNVSRVVSEEDMATFPPDIQKMVLSESGESDLLKRGHVAVTLLSVLTPRRIGPQYYQDNFNPFYY